MKPNLKSEYFKHDYNARGDDHLVKLRMKLGTRGYGTYWLIVEKLYECRGRLERDYQALRPIRR